MAVYHTAEGNPTLSVVPDAFLSIGVERRKIGKSRLSYAGRSGSHTNLSVRAIDVILDVLIYDFGSLELLQFYWLFQNFGCRERTA
jgi:hypothetical protein